jgi:hypothetical protein
LNRYQVAKVHITKATDLFNEVAVAVEEQELLAATAEESSSSPPSPPSSPSSSLTTSRVRFELASLSLERVQAVRKQCETKGRCFDVLTTQHTFMAYLFVSHILLRLCEFMYTVWQY